jgi:hypothetical protein
VTALVTEALGTILHGCLCTGLEVSIYRQPDGQSSTSATEHLEPGTERFASRVLN